MLPRFVAFLAAGVVVALVTGRAVPARLDSRVHDALLALSARTVEPPGRARVRVFTVDAEAGGDAFTAREVVAALRAFGARESAAAVVSLPPLPPLAAEDAVAIRGALFGLGRVLLVLDPGGDPPPPSARIDRIGRGADLPPPRTVRAVDPRILAGLPATAVADLVADADGIVRRFPVAYGPRESTVPSLPVAIAARALHESSIRLSRDLRTLESLGARDLALYGRNELLVRLRAERDFAPRPLPELGESGGPRKRPPVRILAFAGGALAREVDTALGDRRLAAEVVADAVEDLLTSRTAYSPNPRRTGAAVVVAPPLLATACSLPRSRRGRLLIGLAIGFGAMAFVAVATWMGMLVPVAPLLAALLLGAGIEFLWRRFARRV